jgi:hypothetical protein
MSPAASATAANRKIEEFQPLDPPPQRCRHSDKGCLWRAKTA